MSEGPSALYVGSVIHVRVKPRRHRLSYRLFSLLIDLDELEALDRRLRLFSLNRLNLFSFFERDYGAGDGGSLKAHVERTLTASGLPVEGGPVRLLTMPRVLGYAFNPLSVYFCHRRDGSLLAVLYEVNNTFGQRHSYLIPVGPEETAPLRHKAEKRFYVSPFMDMDLTYSFRVEPPGEGVRIAILACNGDGPVLSAVHSARRRALNDGRLAFLLVSHPLLTLKVVAGIHWEALWIWAKGMRLRPRPPAPDRPVTVWPSHRS